MVGAGLPLEGRARGQGPHFLEGLNKGRVYAGSSVYSASLQTWWGGGDVSLAGWGTLLCEIRGPFLPTTEPHSLSSIN